jgi:hypothetical protein
MFRSWLAGADTAARCRQSGDPTFLEGPPTRFHSRWRLAVSFRGTCLDRYGDTRRQMGNDTLFRLLLAYSVVDQLHGPAARPCAHAQESARSGSSISGRAGAAIPSTGSGPVPGGSQPHDHQAQPHARFGPEDGIGIPLEPSAFQFAARRLVDLQQVGCHSPSPVDTS